MPSDLDRRLAALEGGRPDNLVVTIRGGLPDENAEQHLATVGGLEFHREPDEPVSEFRARMGSLAALMRMALVFGGLPGLIVELDVVKGLRDGVLQSPQTFYGATYFALRISGTGAAWRGSTGSVAVRDAAIWLTPEMCSRWAGAPVLILHPDKGVVTTASFARQVVGSLVLAFVRGDELMGIARICDADAAAAIASGGADTSPAVVFAKGAVRAIEHDGGRVEIEGEPVLIDHLAVLPPGGGVWSKSGGTDPGVETSTQVGKVTA